MRLGGKRVLVTGADGFIGSHLVERLVEHGCRVRALAQYNSFNSWGWLDTLPREVLASIEVVQGDVRDPFGMRSAMEGCEVVMHLAALIAIPYSYRAPSAYVETNVVGTLNVLEAARALRIERLVHTSTSEVYGTARTVPISEEHPLAAQSPYAATKIAADQLALSYWASFELPVSVIRPFNTYGPRQSARAVLPTVITQLAGGAESIKLGALHPTRDFNFVTDTARGFIALAECDEAVGQVTNIGSNYEVSVGDAVQLIAEIMGKPVRIITDEQRVRPARSEVERLWADNSKALAMLKWSPKYGGREGLRRGLQKTIEWFTNPANLASYKTDLYNL